MTDLEKISQVELAGDRRPGSSTSYLSHIFRTFSARKRATRGANQGEALASSITLRANFPGVSTLSRVARNETTHNRDRRIPRRANEIGEGGGGGLKVFHFPSAGEWAIWRILPWQYRGNIRFPRTVLPLNLDRKTDLSDVSIYGAPIRGACRPRHTGHDLAEIRGRRSRAREEQSFSFMRERGDATRMLSRGCKDPIDSIWNVLTEHCTSNDRPQKETCLDISHLLPLPALFSSADLLSVGPLCHLPRVHGTIKSRISPSFSSALHEARFLKSTCLAKHSRISNTGTRSTGRCAHHTRLITHSVILPPRSIVYCTTVGSDAVGQTSNDLFRDESACSGSTRISGRRGAKFPAEEFPDHVTWRCHVFTVGR